MRADATFFDHGSTDAAAAAVAPRSRLRSSPSSSSTSVGRVNTLGVDTILVEGASGSDSDSADIRNVRASNFDIGGDEVVVRLGRDRPRGGAPSSASSAVDLADSSRWNQLIDMVNEKVAPTVGDRARKELDGPRGKEKKLQKRTGLSHPGTWSSSQVVRLASQLTRPKSHPGGAGAYADCQRICVQVVDEAADAWVEGLWVACREKHPTFRGVPRKCLITFVNRTTARHSHSAWEVRRRTSG